MALERFVDDGRPLPSKKALAKITTAGRITFNEKAVEEFELGWRRHLGWYWNPHDRQIIIERSTTDIGPALNEKNALNIKRFLSFKGVDFSVLREYPVHETNVALTEGAPPQKVLVIVLDEGVDRSRKTKGGANDASESPNPTEPVDTKEEPECE